MAIYTGKQGMRKVGNVVGIEARAIHNTLIHNNNRGGYYNDGGSVKSHIYIDMAYPVRKQNIQT